MALIWVLLAAVVSAVAAQGSPTCPDQCVPGLEKIGVGVDLTWFTPREQATISPRRALKLPVVKLTSSAATQPWRNPFTNQTLGTWDQVARIYDEQRTVTKSEHVEFREQFDFYQYFEGFVDGSVLFGLFDAGGEFSEWFSATFQNNASMGHQYGHVDCFVATLAAAAELQPDDGFLKTVDTGFPELWWLPANWEKTRAHFAQFGTHYINEVRAGGQYHYTSVCDSAYVRVAGGAHVAMQEQFDFLGLLKEDAGIDTGAAAVEQAFVKSCAREVDCLGGNGLCHTNNTDQYAAWVESVHSNPWVLEARYALNSDLLKGHTPKHPSHAAASVAYLGWSGLTTLFEILVVSHAELARLSRLPTALCHTSYVDNARVCNLTTNLPLSGGGITISECFNVTASNPQDVVPVLQPLAAALVGNSTGLITEINTTLTSQLLDARFVPHLPKVPRWVAAVWGLAKFAFGDLEFISCNSGFTVCEQTEPENCCWGLPTKAPLCAKDIIASCDAYPPCQYHNIVPGTLFAQDSAANVQDWIQKYGG